MDKITRKPKPRIALFAERRDGHAGLLIAALAKRGVEAVPVALKHCAVMTTAPHGLHIPGFEDGLPSGAFVRGISAGSFEQVTVRLGFLHALRELGVPVWNDARAIETCIDKAMTSHLIAKAGLPTPATWTAQSREAAAAIAARETAEGRALVLKPLFGSQGKGLMLIRSPADLPPEDAPGIAGLYYLQRFVERAGDVWQDMRVFVVRGEAVAGMVRVGESWITNMRQGGQPHKLLLTPDLAGLAVRAAAVTGADYAGVDLIAGGDGETLVLEVNSMPAWAGLQQVAPGIDIADAIAGAFLAVLRDRPLSYSRAIL
ncbi:MAG: RimK family alpha-L-glutamate ligase [Hyphomicrobiales bacterium]|nr:RimK family alpha-L-glutamate ligase [Hyphomicrobiales bacterium]